MTDNITLPRATVQQVLDALLWADAQGENWQQVVKKAIKPIQEAAAQPEPVQEPFGYLWPTGSHPEFRFTQQKRDGADGMQLYTAPLQQQAEPRGWQPIETAPKDAIVLLCLPLIGNIREGDRRVYEGRWHEAQATWTSVNGFLLFGAATNWMPLPQPPITAHGIKDGT